MASPLVPAGGGTDWEARYRAGDTPWEKGRAHPALVRWLKNQSMAGRVLVPGSGSGHDVRVLANDPFAKVIGLDVAPSALTAARSYPVVGSEEYRLGDFLAGEATDLGPFDWIFEHTCFCAIHPSARLAYAQASAAALRRDGHLLAVFYRDPGHGDSEGPPYGCAMEEVDALFCPWFELVSEEKNFETFEGRENREVLRLLRKK